MRFLLTGGVAEDGGVGDFLKLWGLGSLLWEDFEVVGVDGKIRPLDGSEVASG